MSEIRNPDFPQLEIARLTAERDKLAHQVKETLTVVRWCDEAVHQLLQTVLTHAQKEGVLMIIGNKLNGLTAHERMPGGDDYIPF